ncbi:hypothetical protein NPIL_293901, partial [Nephila pilipes]
MSQNSQLTCYICVQRCESLSGIKDHLMVVHGIKDKKNFICRYCEKPFSKKFNLQRHIKSVHKVDVQQKIDLTGAESECPIEENCGDPMET